MLAGLPNCGGSAADRTVTGNLSTSCSFQKGTSNELGGVIGSWDHMVTMWWEDHALYNIIWVGRKLYLMWWWQKKTILHQCWPAAQNSWAMEQPWLDLSLGQAMTRSSSSSSPSLPPPSSPQSMGHHSDGSATLGSGKIRSRRGRWWRGEEGKKDKKKINR